MNNARAAFAAKEILASCESGQVTGKQTFGPGNPPLSPTRVAGAKGTLPWQILTRLPLITYKSALLCSGSTRLGYLEYCISVYILNHM